MIRRDFRLITLLLIAFAFFAATSTATRADSKLELDTRVSAALERLYAAQPEAQSLASKAVAIMVFPRIMKGGVGLGGELGEGAMLVNGETTQYYRLTSVSFGFQLGVQAKSEVILFMTQDSYQNFSNHDGWEAGVDGSIAVVEFGVGRAVDTNSIRDPIIAFIFGNKGLMYNLSLEGSKFWKIKK
jgi:lipid-binding SYLF domain-containing protein